MSEFRSAYAESDRDGERRHEQTEAILESWGAPRDPETGRLIYSEVAYAKATVRASEEAVRADALELALLELDDTVPPLDDGAVTRNDLYERAADILAEQGTDVPTDADWNAALKQAIEELGRPGEQRKDRSVSSARVRDRLLDKAQERGAIRARDRASWEERWAADPKVVAKLVAGLEPDATFATFARRDGDGRVVEAPDDASMALHEATERLLVLAGFTGTAGKNPYTEQDYAEVLVAFGGCEPEWRDALEMRVTARGPFGIANLAHALRLEGNLIVQAIEEGALS
jgi:hypothetical protein